MPGSIERPGSYQDPGPTRRGGGEPTIANCGAGPCDSQITGHQWYPEDIEQLDQ